MGAVVIPSNLPVGYRFHPTDEEFVDHYLKNRVRGFVDRPCIIPDVDICRWDPWQLPQKFHGESVIFPDDKVREWWFFCPQTTEQVKRSTPSGYWKKTGTDRNVKARYTNRAIGTKKTLVFHEGRGKKGVKTNWVIHEYHLPDDDLNGNYVLCRLKDKGDEKADDSTVELEPGAMLADLVSVLHQPDNEDSFPESLIQAMMRSLMDPSFQAISRDLPQLLQPALQSHPFMDIESPPFMDSSLGRSLAECHDFLFQSNAEYDVVFLCGKVGDTLYADLVDASPSSIRQGRQSMPCGRTSDPHDDRPVLVEDGPRFELQMFTPPVEKKGMGENESNSPLAAPEKPMPPPGVECYSEDEEPRFEKVKQETAAESMKPECKSLDETAAGAKYGQSYTVENRRTPAIESLPRGFRFEEMEGALQSEFESLHVSSAKPLELLNDPETQRIHSDEEQTFEKVKKQECPLGNVKPECVSWVESAAAAKVLEYKESISAGSSPKRTNSEEIDHAREKSKLVTALARPTTKNTQSSRNPPRFNPVNVVVGISLSIAIIAIFATIWRRA